VPPTPFLFDMSSSDHRPGSAFRTMLRINPWVGQRVPKRCITEPLEPYTTKQLVETVDDFVAVQSLLLQQGSTSLNTSRVSH
jgi:hypothetical protein